ncbi:MAG: DUF5683 domain-containing protein [Candidatus Eisenbacteria bacterium]
MRTSALLLVLLALTACPRPAAAEGGERGIPYAHVQGPAQSLVASAVYPGLGQLLNDSEHKAAVIGGVEAFLVARLVLEDRWTRHSFRLYQETGQSRYFSEYSDHFDARQTLVWWVIVAALYGIADAYVDAHLMGFDDMRPDTLDDWSERPGDAALRIGFACRF